MGTTNFGDDVFSNPWPFITELYQLSPGARGGAGVRAVRPRPRRTRCSRLLGQYGLPYGGRVHVDLVMGVPGGMPGTADALVAGGRRPARRR